MTRAARTALVAVALLWLAVPLLPLVAWAAADRWSFPDILPQEWGLRGWREASRAGLTGAMLTSLLLGAAVATAATPLGVMAGRALGWRLLVRPRLVVGVLLLPLALPPFAISMGLDVVLIRLGIPALLAVFLLLVVMATPYTAYTCAVGFARTSPALGEQARALGATPGQARRRVILPAVRSSILVAAMLAFLVGWSDYVVTLLVGGGTIVTAPLLLGSAASGSGNEAQVAALALATLVPPVLLITAAGWLQSTRTDRPLPAAPHPSVEERTAT
ncbi:MAG: ABC transporter permease subunit [Ornithinimicrobium sp.]|uniref:ABC transporter permease n=1 Tax=Ornithinimicrobium sp. TaxID=1977084 RepID=UPI0026DFD9C3|nr:ABC transporter permease subunit [Ornithinimicrobium sp.]MDO5740199.1 ABC transporter permease subunit [Ornithinimicrobium sp.]